MHLPALQQRRVRSETWELGVECTDPQENLYVMYSCGLMTRLTFL